MAQIEVLLALISTSCVRELEPKKKHIFCDRMSAGNIRFDRNDQYSHVAVSNLILFHVTRSESKLPSKRK